MSSQGNGFHQGSFCLFVDLSNLKAHCVTFNVIYGYEMEQLLYKYVFVFHSLVMSFDIYLKEQVHLQSRACVCVPRSVSKKDVRSSGTSENWH